VQTQASDPASLLNHYKKLIAVRNATPSIAHGGYVSLQSSDPGVYAFLRTPEGKSDSAAKDTAALVVINLGGNRISKLALTSDATSLRGIYSGKDALSEAKIDSLKLAETGDIASLELTEVQPFSTRVYLLNPKK
jgi:glycosidase